MGEFIEQNFGKGCILQEEDERDYHFEETLGAGQVMTDEEWKQGYDIEKVLGFELKPNNQFSSMSCVGQAGSKYSAVLNCVELKKFDDNSAKAVYSQITSGYGQGANLRDAMALIVDWGEVYESLVKSYKPDGTTDESWMIDKTWMTKEITDIAKNFKAKEYRLITGMGIDYFARAIKDGYGMMAGVTGTNNGTWASVEPQPPTDNIPQNQLWGHALYFGKFGIDEKGKYIEFLNSWGNIGNRGWQKLRENWFVNDNRWVFNPWVLIDKPNTNNNDMFTFKKIKGDKNIWICREDNKTRAVLLDMTTMSFFTDTFEEVDNLNSYIVKGTNAMFDREITD